MQPLYDWQPAENTTVSSHPITAEEYGDFREFLEKACGIVLGDNKQYLVSSRLNRILAEYELESLGQLVRVLRDHRSSALRERIIEAMTTNETSWFRDNHPFQTLRDTVFPQLAKMRQGTVRIWSAACSSGQEPYSISMVVHEYQMANPGALTGEVQIVATDISPAMLRDARAGRYDALAMARGLSPERKERYFRPHGDTWEVISPIRARVQFRELNLLQSYALLGRFDVIFCRNVLIYFSSKSKRDIVVRMAKALKPGGYLFLGGSESISGLSDAFEMVRSPGGVVYRLKS
ncbi:MAG: protein-glutamate O-methyltransferase CheR [Gammaproteobacteria bacterium]|jgi:chemotaxis protein methyltransferase CheR